jgi:glycosyltransferase involved in cell wall biosynthesis
MNGEPTVSVVIPTYDRPTFLEGAIDTVLQQTYDDLKMIVVDDGSETDYARATVDEYDDAPVRLVEHDENRGLSAARNTGIRNARGAYVAFLDDDDRWHAEKLARQVPVLENDPAVGLVTCCLASLSPDGEILRCEKSKPSGDLSETIFRKNVIGTPSRVLVRNECFEEVGVFDEELPTKQDWDLYIRICREWRVRCLEELLCFRTVHESMSSDPGDAERDLMRIRERYREEIEACGMWEESMAAYHRKVGVTYLSAGDRKTGKAHLRRVLEYERSVGSVMMYLLGLVPHQGFRGIVRTKRAVERSLHSCSERIPSSSQSSQQTLLINKFSK